MEQHRGRPQHGGGEIDPKVLVLEESQNIRAYVERKIDAVNNDVSNVKSDMSGVKENLKHAVTYKSLWSLVFVILTTVAAAISAGAGIAIAVAQWVN